MKNSYVWKGFDSFCRMDSSMKTTSSHQNQPTIESLQAQIEELTKKVRWYEEQFRLSQQRAHLPFFYTRKV